MSALPHVLALDLGGTNVKAGIVSPDGTIIASTSVPSGERAGVDAWLDAAMAAADQVLSATEVAPAAIGLSVPGAVDPARAVLLDLVDRMAVGDGLNLAASFSRFGLNVYADNDARAALLAEHRWGAARDVDDVVTFTLGTGLGGCVLLGGELLPGEPILTGIQLGHLTVELDGPVCVCGNRGCAELWASGTGVARMARERGLGELSAAEVFARSSSGHDEVADSIIDRFTDALVAAIVNAVHAYQPELVVLAGAPMASSDRFLPAVEKGVAERAWTAPGRQVRIVASPLGPTMGVLGAAAIVYRRLS